MIPRRKATNLKTSVAVDVKSMIRKVSFHVYKNINWALKSTWTMIISPGVINRYLQNSIKESERAHRSNTTLIDIVDLGLESVIPVDLKSFWSSASIKHLLQLASRKIFQNKSFLNKIDMILNGYMTDVYVDRMMMIGVITKDPELCFSIKEADSRIIPHIAIACQEETERVVAMLNAFDVVT